MPAIQGRSLLQATLTINDQPHDVEVPSGMPLLWVLRDVVGLTGTKYGCGLGLCGACTVHLAGEPVRSCLLPVESVGGRAITTIEGRGATPAGARVQRRHSVWWGKGGADRLKL